MTLRSVYLSSLKFSELLMKVSVSWICLSTYRVLGDETNQVN